MASTEIANDRHELASSSGGGFMSGRKPRICVLTARGLSHQVFMTAGYEAEDILLEIDDAELIYLRPRRGYGFRQRTHARLVWHDFTKSLVFANAAFEPVKLTKEYDLLVAYLPNKIEHLLHFAAVRGWKDYCRTSVCWIDEIYASDIPSIKYWLPALTQIDHIVVGYSGSVTALAQAIKRPCHWIPSGVDAIRFTPSSRFADKIIDIYSMGRRAERLHRALLDLAAKNGMFYVYDTVETSSANVYDYKQHRDMLANIMKRTRYFTVAPAKGRGVEAAGNQSELGYRYYEGSAAGTIMLGPSPRCEAFETMFNWQDAVVEINANGSDVAKVISILVDQPERLIEVSRRNTVQALLRHDWAYRWKKILEIANVEPAPQLQIRENRLKQLAERAGNA
jgi:Glycosyl transferases group 1